MDHSEQEYQELKEECRRCLRLMLTWGAINIRKKLYENHPIFREIDTDGYFWMVIEQTISDTLQSMVSPEFLENLDMEDE
mgnify:CR=1 FL=1